MLFMIVIDSIVLPFLSLNGRLHCVLLFMLYRYKKVFDWKQALDEPKAAKNDF